MLKIIWMCFRIVFVPEEFLLADEEERSSPDLGDIGTKLGELGDSTETLDHACLSDIQEQFEE